MLIQPDFAEGGPPAAPGECQEMKSKDFSDQHVIESYLLGSKESYFSMSIRSSLSKKGGKMAK
jgi:hypothetical protein